MDEAARTELNALIEDMSPEDRATIAGCTEGQLTFLRFGLGLYIRNQIRQHHLPVLHKWVSGESAVLIRDDDDDSDTIIREISKSLRAAQPAA